LGELGDETRAHAINRAVRIGNGAAHWGDAMNERPDNQDDEDTRAAWHKQEEDERRHWDRVQETLKSDPYFGKWLDVIDQFFKRIETKEDENVDRKF
jgi:hypothetical protein